MRRSKTGEIRRFPTCGLFYAAMVVAMFFGPVTAAETPKPSAYIVSFGTFGSQSVFDSEARAAARLLAEYFHPAAPPFIRTNTKTTSAVTQRSLGDGMRSAERAMVRDRDILVLFLTSHGTRRGVVVQGKRGVYGLITPSTIGQMLKMSGARYRIVIVSACFSGIFSDKLADKNTLVITAAAADRASFGCEDRASWTYFGEAFFQRALHPGRSLAEVFTEAKGLIEAREADEQMAPASNPQFRGGENVLKHMGQ